jgi:biopolymer transport protein ExbB
MQDARTNPFSAEVNRMNKILLNFVRNFSVTGTSSSRRFWVALRLSVAVTFLSCLLVLVFAGIKRADSQSSNATIENDSLSRKQNLAGEDTDAKINSSFPTEADTIPESLSNKVMTLLQETSLIHLFKKGGLIMWPLLLASILAQGTVIERIIFLISERRKHDPHAMEMFFAAVGQGNTEGAIQISNKSKFYVVRTLGYALTHRKKSIASALLYAQEQELKRFRRGIPILDMVITLAPLLGLLGTVTGMMGSFSLIGGELSTPGAITGGIAEALIATAFGLGIAITALIPFNLLNNLIEKTRLEIESAATKLELLMFPPASTSEVIVKASHPCQPGKMIFEQRKRNSPGMRSRKRIPISFPKG